MKASVESASLAISSVQRNPVLNRLRATTLANTTASSPSSATSRTVSAAPLTMRISPPPSAASAGSAARPTELSASRLMRRSTLSRLQHPRYQIGTDLVAELGIDRVHRRAERGVIDIGDRQPLGLEEGLVLLRFVGNGLAPDGLDFGGRVADRLLERRVERIELALARHQRAGVVDVVGQRDALDDLVEL